MEDEKIKIGTTEIQNIKMTNNERENILGNILGTSAVKKKPIKSPYSSVSMFRNPVFYYAVLFIVVAGISGGGIYFKNQTNKYPNNLAYIPRNNNSTTFENQNFQNQNQEITKNIFQNQIQNQPQTISPSQVQDNNKPTGKSVAYLENKNQIETPAPPSVSAPEVTYVPPIPPVISSGNQNNTPQGMMMAPTRNYTLSLSEYLEITSSSFDKYLVQLAREKGEILNSRIENMSFIVAKANAQGQELSYFSVDTSNNAFIVQITYSIHTTESGMANWLAGNGIESENYWVLNKTTYLTIDKNPNDGTFYVKSEGTGL